MANTDDQFKKVVAHAKEYGFIFPSSEIYDGLGAVYDYGQNGVELKKNIREYWWRAMVQMNENIVGIDAAIFMHPTTWKASGHVDAFNDPLIDNKDSKKRYRADVLVEDYVAKLDDKIEKEIAKAQKRFGDAFDREQFVTTNPRVLEYKQRGEEILHRLGKSLEKEDLADVKALIEELETRLWHVSLFSVCASSNKWKCNSSSNQVPNNNGMSIGKKPASNGTYLWVWVKKTIATTHTKSSPTTPMLLAISSSVSHLVLKN